MTPGEHAERTQMALYEAGRPDVHVFIRPYGDGRYSLVATVFENGEYREPTDEECDLAYKAGHMSGEGNGERAEGYPSMPFAIDILDHQHRPVSQ